jgi:hypothetical protein
LSNCQLNPHAVVHGQYKGVGRDKDTGMSTGRWLFGGFLAFGLKEYLWKGLTALPLTTATL